MKKTIVVLLLSVCALFTACNQTPDTYQTITVTDQMISNAGGDVEKPVNVREDEAPSEEVEEEKKQENKEEKKSEKKDSAEKSEEKGSEEEEKGIKEIITEKAEEFVEEVEDNVQNPQERATIVRVVDGDTYVVTIGDSKEEVKVRLIGVDTPESVASDEYLEKTGKENTDFGKEVSDYMKSKLSAGDHIMLEYDVEKTDKYDRVLVYAYFSTGEMIQIHLLKLGYAQVMTVQPNVAHVDWFVKTEEEAIKNKVGIWAE